MLTRKIWKENIPLFKKLCRDSDVYVTFSEEDIDEQGDAMFLATYSEPLPWRSIDYYEKHRVRK